MIELVISAAVSALILAGAYLCFNAAIAGQKLIEPRTEVVQNARVSMSLLCADLRTACPLSSDFEFLGMPRQIDDSEADNLDFATHHYGPRREGEGDFCEVSYFVEKDAVNGDLNLLRRRNPIIAADPLAGGHRELIARGLREVKFEYYDGYDWYDTWGETNPRKKERKQAALAPNISGMPEAVRITLSFNPSPKKLAPGSPPPSSDSSITNEPSMVFQTVARLNLAGSSQRGFSGQSSKGNADAESSDQPQPPSAQPN